MENVLTFIIPVRHQDNAKNWPRVKRTLTETARSIAAQKSEGWKAVVIANHGADLPTLPKGFDVARVDFPPNQLHAKGNATRGQFFEAFRIDKGRRVLAGMLHAGEMGHVMIVDDDDFVSNRLTGFVAANRQANGWYLGEGHVWSDGGWLLYRHPDFSNTCGSSHVVRSDLYRLPPSFEVADDTYISQMLGSHIFLHEQLEASGTPLAPLPFLGAVYRIGHPEAHSQSDSIPRKYFLDRDLLRQKKEFCRRIFRLGLKTRGIEREFFGRV